MDVGHINYLTLIGETLKRIGGTNGGEWAGPCPWCGGRDRFRVWPTPRAGNPAAWCRQCGWSGDPVAYVMRRDNCDFRQAVATLGLDNSRQQARTRIEQPRQHPTIAAPSELRTDYPALADPAWQQRAALFVEECRDRLWTDEGRRARNYLTSKRLLTEPVINWSELGYNDADRRETWGSVEVWLPRGIVIPWRIDDLIWRVNIRRPVTGKEQRYIQPAGCAPGLYLVDSLHAESIAVMVEGEFDALVLRSMGVMRAGLKPVATGSSTSARALRWVTVMRLVRGVLLAFDADEAGDHAAAWWMHYLDPTRTRRARPVAHDVTEMVAAYINIKDWLRAAVAA